jgi:nucleotide-binding universal stress UspA family protein
MTRSAACGKAAVALAFDPDSAGRGRREDGLIRKEPTMKLIVHATDGSPEAGDALDLAIELAHDTGAKLAIVSVHVVHVGGKGISPPISEVEQPHGAEHIAAVAADRARAAGVETKPYVVAGEPAKEITRLAKELDADLIVVGSRGLGAVHTAIFGSVSKALVARSTTPVLVVKTASGREPKRNHALVDDGAVLSR